MQNVGERRMRKWKMRRRSKRRKRKKRGTSGNYDPG